MRLTLLRTGAALAITLLLGCGPEGSGDETGTAGTGAGTGGATGNAGTTGHGGTTGNAGTVGTSGGAGTTGVAGNTGVGGSLGGAGTTGSAGTGGTGGLTGAAGTAGNGSTGSAGTGGSTGAAGRGGSGGSGGGAGGGGAGGGGAGRGGTGGGNAGRGGTGGASAGSGGGGSTGSGGSGSYNPCPTNGDPCVILPVGDSITFGINYEGAWRPEIFHRAVMAGQKITFGGTLQNGPQTIDNMPFPRRYEATSGITIDGISQQLTRNNTLTMQPLANIVMVHIGTNDISGNLSGSGTRLGNLLDKITTALPNALVVVAKIIPFTNASQYNAMIPGVVDPRVAQGKHIIIVDCFTNFPAGGMDAVHPYQSGYNWMGDRFYEGVSSLLPK
jgi:hypothetical protein